MSRIFHSEDIIKNLQRELDSTSANFTIISAFVKLEALKFIDLQTNDVVKDKRLLVRFQLNDLLSGGTDFEIYDYCKKNGWRMFINLYLHSKIYIFDSKRFILGSANVTSSGLGLKKHSNIESMVRGELTDEELLKINSLFDQSIELSDQLIETLTNYLENAESFKELHGEIPYIEWETEIMSSLDTDINLLWTTDFFFSYSPLNLCNHDLNLLEIELTKFNSIDLIKVRFKKAKCFKWLKSLLKEEEELYFGELTAMLHTALIDDPRPYRKDVKILLSNLLNWIVELRIDEFIIDRPNYSQRIRWNGIKSSL